MSQLLPEDVRLATILPERSNISPVFGPRMSTHEVWNSTFPPILNKPLAVRALIHDQFLSLLSEHGTEPVLEH